MRYFTSNGSGQCRNSSSNHIIPYREFSPVIYFELYVVYYFGEPIYYRGAFVTLRLKSLCRF